MRFRLARAQGVALAGVATAAVFAGGLLFSVSGARHSAVTAKTSVLAGPTPHWHDGYNHFILTMAAPVSTTAYAPSPPGKAGRRPVEAASGEPEGAVAAHSSPLVGQAVGHAGGLSGGAPGAAADEAARRGAGAEGTSVAVSGAFSPAGAGGDPWQSVAPNPDEPIVLRAGQPMTLLPKLLARFPKGTTLVRDRDGNLRAVLPPGSHYGRYSGPPVKSQRTGKAAGEGAGGASAKRAGETGPHEGGGGRQGRPTTKSAYPPGWGPESAAITASLLKVPGVHAASPVWGDRYQVTTTLGAGRLKALPGVEKVAPNNLLTAASVPATNDPDLNLEYYLANDGQSVLGQAGTSGASGDFSYAWARARGTGVLIADIDTGVDLANPDLAGQISPLSENFSVSPPNGDVQVQGQAAGFYHGTSVDGVMVGLAGNGWGGAGAAPGAQVMALKCGDTSTFTDSCIYAAGEYAINEGVKVINMSFGEKVSSDPTMQSLIADADKAGVLVTAAAGNWGSDNDRATVLPAGFSTQYPNVISVGATDNQDNLASFSDYGATTVELMAPGAGIFTDYPTYSGYGTAYASGTSYAAPLVAATAALLWSADGSLTDTQVKNDILSSAQAVPGLSGKCTTGGRLDAQAALALVSEPVQFTFTGFDEVQPSQPAQLSVNVTSVQGSLPSGTPLGYHLELAYNYDGQMYEVVGQQLGWSIGGSPAQTVTTSSTGSVLIAPAAMDAGNFGAEPLELSLPSPGLPAGTYALVAYAAEVSAPSTPIGNPQAVFFNVGQASPTPPPSTTTTVAPATTASVPAATTTAAGTATTVTTAPGTTVPGTGGTVTTAPGTSGGAVTTAPATTSPGTGGTGTGGTGTGGTGTTTSIGAPTSPGSATTTVPSASTTVGPGAGAGNGTTSATTAVSATTAPAPVTTVPAGPTTTSPATGTSSFSIDSVAPDSLPASGGDLSIFGNNFPPNPVVMVGSTAAAVSDASATEIDVMVGALPSGSYTVTVYNATQSESASLAEAVTVAGGAGDSGNGGSGGGGAGGTGGTGGAGGAGGATTTTVVGTTTSSPVTTTAGAVTTTSAPVTTTSAPVTTTSGAPAATLPGASPSSTPVSVSTADAARTTSTTSGATTLPTTGPVTSTSGGATTTEPASATTTSAGGSQSGGGGTVVGPDGMVLSSVSTGNPLSAMSVGEWPALTASQVIEDNGQSSGSPVDGVDV